MMDYVQVIQQFKDRHTQGGLFKLTLLPLLMRNLVDSGLTLGDIDGKFYQDVSAELFGKEDLKLIGYVSDALVVLSQMVPIPKTAATPEVEGQRSTPTTKVEADYDIIIRTENLVDTMPSEYDEGDPLYTPPEDRIALRPEDCAPMQFDEEFAALVGANLKDRYK